MASSSRSGGRRNSGNGLSLISIITGTLVAFGVMFLLSSITAAVVGGSDVSVNDAARDPVALGIGAAATLVLFQFVSYLWGGYTAGRMAGRAGVSNGLMVAVTAILLAIIAGVIGYTIADRTLDIPAMGLLPVTSGTAVRFTAALGAAALVAMLVGSAIGGMIGEKRTVRTPAVRDVSPRSGKGSGGKQVQPVPQSNGSVRAKGGQKRSGRR